MKETEERVDISSPVIS